MKYFIPIPKPAEKAKTYPTYEYREGTKIENGNEVRFLEKVEIDPASVNDGLTVADFSLDVLIRNGSSDLLKVNHPVSVSALHVASNIENNL